MPQLKTYETFRLGKENKTIKDRIIIDIRNVFRPEKKELKIFKVQVSLGVTIILNIKVEEEHYQVDNILMKLNQERSHRLYQKI